MILRYEIKLFEILISKVSIFINHNINLLFFLPNTLRWPRTTWTPSSCVPSAWSLWPPIPSYRSGTPSPLEMQRILCHGERPWQTQFGERSDLHVRCGPTPQTATGSRCVGCGIVIWHWEHPFVSKGKCWRASPVSGQLGKESVQNNGHSLCLPHPYICGLICNRCCPTLLSCCALANKSVTEY